MAEESQLTVVIPTWNRKELLRKCLNSLVKQSVPSLILVIDNGSADSTAQMCTRDFPQVSYVRLEQNLGFAKAANIGIQKVETEFVALLNNDTEVEPDWAEIGLSAFRKYSDYWFFASKMIQYHHREYLDSAGDCYNRTGLPYKRGFGERIANYSKPEPVLGASAGGAFYRRGLFERIGLFDENYFMYLEDVNFSLRAQMCGFPCLYLPDAIVFHMEAASDNEYPSRLPCRSPSSAPYSKNRVYWITRNRWQLMMTFQPMRHFSYLTYGWTKSFFFHLLKAGFLGCFLKGLAAGILQTSHALRERRKLAASKALTNREICQLLSRC